MYAMKVATVKCNQSGVGLPIPNINESKKINTMTIKIQQSIIGGIVATAIMTMIMWIAPMMGMPKMDIPGMLSGMMGFPIVVGWFMHFMIGITFAIIYAFVIINWLKKINNNILKGAIFGLLAFIIAQISLGILGAIFPMPPIEGSMILMMVGSIMGHVIFGITVAMFVKEQS